MAEARSRKTKVVKVCEKKKQYRRREDGRGQLGDQSDARRRRRLETRGLEVETKGLTIV